MNVWKQLCEVLPGHKAYFATHETVPIQIQPEQLHLPKIRHFLPWQNCMASIEPTSTWWSTFETEIHNQFTTLMKLWTWVISNFNHILTKPKSKKQNLNTHRIAKEENNIEKS